MQKENAPLVGDEQAPDEIYPETPVIVTMRLGPGHSSSRNRVMSGAAFRSAIIVASNGAGAADSD